MNHADKIDALRGAFDIRYAILHYENYTNCDCDYVTPSDVSDHDGHGRRPWVSFEDVARGTDTAGQTCTAMRSNFRSLQRDYPGVWTNISYSNVDGLGAFVDDLDDNLIRILIGLKHDYLLYDENDIAEWESDEIAESWDAYLSADLYRDLPADWQEAREAADAIGSTAVRDAFFNALSEVDYYPEHDGLDIRWDAAVCDRAIKSAISAVLRQRAHDRSRSMPTVNHAQKSSPRPRSPRRTAEDRDTPDAA